MEKYFNLRTKVGTKIFSANGDFVLDKVPDNALFWFLQGVTWLGLKPEAVDFLVKNPLVNALLKLEKLKKLREQQGFLDDVEILQSAINQLQSENNKEPPEGSGIPKTKSIKPKK